MPTKKDDKDYTINYYYDSNNNLIGLNNGSDTLFFYYDSDNSPISFSYRNTMYYYVKNLQGDIVKIIDEDGNLTVTYTYDALGNISDARSVGFWFENKRYTDTYTNYAVSVDNIESWTGFDFFVNLPDGVESAAEKNNSWSTFTASY